LPASVEAPNAPPNSETESTVGDKYCTRDPKNCYPSGAASSLDFSVQKATPGVGKTLEKAAQDTGKTIEKAAQDAGNLIQKTVPMTGKIIGAPNSGIDNVHKLGTLFKF
jgi:hypothetical protein